MKTTTTSNSRKVLVPLATLVAAAAVAIGSGATWTASTDASVAVTAGNLLHSNDQEGATLTLTDIKPGDSMSGDVTIANTGSTDSTMAVTSGTVTSTFSDFLEITIIDDQGNSLYSGPLNDLDLSEAAEAALFAEDDTDTAGVDESQVVYTFEVDFLNDTTGDEEAQNADQDATADVTFTFEQTQVDGEELDTNWVS